LHGIWKLIQLKNDPKNWLLIKANDRYAKAQKKFDVTAAEPLSVKTGKDLAEIAAKNTAKKTAVKTTRKKPIKKKLIIKIPQLKQAPMRPITPQLCTLVAQPPADNSWLHEIKFDGYRILCFIKNKKITLISRNKLDWTKKFPYVATALKQYDLPDVILDGEIIAIDEQKNSNFQLLQNKIALRNPDLIYYVFDIIYYDKYDLSQIPLLERKKLLRSLFKKKTIIRYTDHIIGKGPAVLQKACQAQLEGIVSKKIDSPYLQKRSTNWLKTKCVKRQEFVVGGFTKPKGSRKYFGSLLIGTYTTDKKLKYCGHVGTGFDENTLKMIARLLQQYSSSHNPFTTQPPGIRQISWVKPRLVIEVQFSQWTEDGILRQPSFKGLRIDKTAKEVIMEIPAYVNKKANAKTAAALTHSDKILYPAKKITKQELAEYYQRIQTWILPHVIDRPLTLVRCPQGQGKKCFYQKHLHEEIAGPLYTVKIKEKQAASEYLYLKNAAGLIALVQLSALEIHPWECKIDDIEHPDRIIFDLDPGPQIAWKKVIQAALLIRKELEKLSLQSFVKTTGGKGLHIVVPIKRRYTWQEVKTFSHAFVDHLVAQHPQDYVGTITKSKRIGKIFIDYLRNQRGATAIAPYSTRIHPDASVSTPLFWHELSVKIKSDTFNIRNIPARLAKLKGDPWQGFFNLQQTLPASASYL
jgi:bifunctional non-homologous end joining protein LigD